MPIMQEMVAKILPTLHTSQRLDLKFSKGALARADVVDDEDADGAEDEEDEFAVLV